MNIEKAYINPGQAYARQEKLFKGEAPYLEQSRSWKEGMRYQYSPDNYIISKETTCQLRDAGKTVGELLNSKYPNKILEFRLDFVESSRDGKLCVTEVQTDDRGLPAIAIARNSRGPEISGELPGVVESLSRELLRRQEGNPMSTIPLLVTYPEGEKFYYAGFNDFANLCWANECEVLVSTREGVTQLNNDEIEITIPLAGTKIVCAPNLIWNFSEIPFEGNNTIQPLVTKQILLDMTSDNNSYNNLIPQTLLPSNSEVVQTKNDWVLKPIEGRWSQGVRFGFRESEEEWQKFTNQKDVIAQQFIDPQTDLYLIRNGKYKYSWEEMYARVEGYYVYDGEKNEWILADVLATCTSDIPVHGKRDCIMIPGTIVKENI